MCLKYYVVPEREWPSELIDSKLVGENKYSEKLNRRGQKANHGNDSEIIYLVLDCLGIWRSWIKWPRELGELGLGLSV